MRFISVVAWDQAPHCGKKEKKPAFAQKKKKSASEASREVVWEGERVAEPGAMPFMK